VGHQAPGTAQLATNGPAVDETAVTQQIRAAS